MDADRWTAVLRSAVVEDAAAAADDGAVIGQAPVETRRGGEAQVGVLLVAQAIGAEDGRQVLGLGEVVVERVAFERPGEAVVEGEVRAQFPGPPPGLEEAQAAPSSRPSLQPSLLLS